MSFLRYFTKLNFAWTTMASNIPSYFMGYFFFWKLWIFFISTSTVCVLNLLCIDWPNFEKCGGQTLSKMRFQSVSTISIPKSQWRTRPSLMNKPQVLMFTWGANSISFFESSTLSFADSTTTTQLEKLSGFRSMFLFWPK